MGSNTIEPFSRGWTERVLLYVIEALGGRGWTELAMEAPEIGKPRPRFRSYLAPTPATQRLRGKVTLISGSCPMVGQNRKAPCPQLP